MDRQHNKSTKKYSKNKRQNCEDSSEKTETTGETSKEKKVNVVVGLDISTTCTAIVVVEKETGNLVLMQHELMNNKNKYPNFWEKVVHMEKVFDSLPDVSWSVKTVAVEENAKRFSPGFSSADTIITLAKFNGILSYLLFKKYGVPPSYINVRSARKTLGINIDYKDKSLPTKQKVLNHVVNLKPDYPWVYKETKGEQSLTKINEDRADAWVMAEVGRRKI